MSPRQLVVVLACLAVAACGADPVAAPPVPNTLVLVSGDAQQGTPGYRLPNEVAVRLLDDRGDAVVGASITFSSEDPHAVPEPATAVTDSSGVARTWWRLGSGLGLQSLAATATGEAIPARTLTAMAVSQAPKSIAGGVGGMCTVDADGLLRCGLPPTVGAPNPPAWAVVGGSTRFLEVVLVDDLTPGMKGCAIAESGRIWCFTLEGNGSIAGLTQLSGSYPMLHGLVGNGLGTNVPLWCGVSLEGRGWCWGRNKLGLLGTWSFAPETPDSLLLSVRLASIEVGFETNCALTPEGEAWCWGRSRAGETGNVTGSVQGVQVPTTTRFARLAMGDYGPVACGAALSGGLWCWGRGQGMLGVGVTTAIGPIPVAIPGRENVTELAQSGGTLVTVNRDRTGAVWGGLAFIDPNLWTYQFLSFASLPMTSVTTRTGNDTVCGPAAGGTGTLCAAVRSLVAVQYPGAGPLPPVFGIPPQ